MEFAEANRAIAPALVFEFTQEAVRAMGPIEHESLAALAEGRDYAIMWNEEMAGAQKKYPGLSLIHI